MPTLCSVRHLTYYFPSAASVDIALAYTASQAGLASQLKHIRTAAEAGVKLFIPCEYTLEFADCETSPHVEGKTLNVEDMATEAFPLVKLRREAVALCNDLGMPCLQVHTGNSPEVY